MDSSGACGASRPLGRDHWPTTARASAGAAENYDVLKRRRNNTEAACQQAGLQFWPVVLEAQGGMAQGAARATWAIASAVAAKERRHRCKCDG